MSLAAFHDTALVHFCNPPATWRIDHDRNGWWTVTDVHGAPIERYQTQRQAERARHSGPAAEAWYSRTDWYLGYTAGRALTGPERLAVAEIVEQINAAAGCTSAQRPVRFIDQDPDDDRTWAATLRPDGRYHVHGAGPYVHDAEDLEFLDQPADTRLATLVASLIGYDTAQAPVAVA